MKIMKIFGVVMALHVFVLVVIFANPGCSSARSGAATRPTPTDSVSSAPAPLVMPVTPVNAPLSSSLSPIAAMSFDPNAPAVPEGSRAAPLRPGSQSAAAATRPAPAPEPATTVNYTVAGGDSLWKIANANKLTVQELAAANKIPGDSVLKVGQKLVIPVKAGSATAAKPDPAAKGTPANLAGTAPADAKAAAAARKGGTAQAFEYVVQHGETLSSIAVKFKVSAANLATENSLTNPNLVREGMTLLIPTTNPQASTKAGDASKAGAAKGTTPSTIETIGPPRPQGEIPTIKIDALPAGKR